MPSEPAVTTSSSSTTVTAAHDNNNNNNIRQLVFDDFTDLTTQLVLLPRLAEEGVGAVVAAFHPSTATATATDAEQANNNPVGCILLSVGDSKDNNSRRCVEHEDFGSILATLRQSPTPIVLYLVEPCTTCEEATASMKNASLGAWQGSLANQPAVATAAAKPNYDCADEEKKLDVDDCDLLPRGVDTPAACQPQQQQPPNSNSHTVTTVASDCLATPNKATTAITSWDLSSWTMRVRETSAQLADKAASHTKHMRAALATTPTSSFGVTLNSASSTIPTNHNHPSSQQPLLGLFVQSSSGALLPLQQQSLTTTTTTTLSPLSSSSSSVSELSLTNSSLLLVRVSVTEPCPRLGYSFQWYRSSENNKFKDSSSNNDNDEEHQQPCSSWTLLPGATMAAFQPTATEIGRRLRCVVTTTDHHTTTTDSPTTVQPDNTNGGGTGISSIICETDTTVSAALPLWDGTRQALSRGPQWFGGLVDARQGQARFRLKVELGAVPNNNNNDDSCLTVYRDDTNNNYNAAAAAMGGVTAVASYTNPKEFKLVFGMAVVGEEASLAMLDCLQKDDNNDQQSLVLRAPSRLGRESILLAIGIANYHASNNNNNNNKPDLDAYTILFPDKVVNNDEKEMEEPCAAAESLPLNDHVEPSADPEESSSSSSSLSLSSRDIPTPSDCCNSTTRTPPKTTPPRPGLSRPPTSPVPSPLTLKRTLSLDSRQQALSLEDNDTSCLQEQLQLLRTKLTARDQTVVDLQRRVADTESKFLLADRRVSQLDAQLQTSQAERQTLVQSLRQAEQRVEKLVQTNRVLESADQVGRLECTTKEQSERIADLEKTVRTLTNEKAVLSAAVEARESKLAKMTDLQASLDEASVRVAQQESLRNELQETKTRCTELEALVERMALADQESQAKIRESETNMAELRERLNAETSRIASHQSELEAQQLKIQKLKAERNNYKQKGDSLAKEMARVCRNDRTVRQVEKILADDVTRRQEVELLREQKRKALEDLDHYRTAYEQSKMAQRMAGLDHDSSKLLERNAELERLLSELTEYLGAKEMQLETMKAVNDALQSEIRDLAKANMSKNDI